LASFTGGKSIVVGCLKRPAGTPGVDFAHYGVAVGPAGLLDAPWEAAWSGLTAAEERGTDGSLGLQLRVRAVGIWWLRRRSRLDLDVLA